jgi:predicted nucleotidyltransferase
MEKVVKILGGYEITVSNDTHIEKLTKEKKNTRFSYKFYERHKKELDVYENIQDFVKPQQNRDKQDRVSVNLKNGKTNTNDAEKLVLGSALLLLAADGRIEKTGVLKEIISLAKEKLLKFDSVLLDLQAEGKKLEGLAKDMADIFGADSENVLQVKEKFNAVAKKIRERVEFLTKSV